MQQIDARSANAAQKGRLFEQLTKAFLEQEKNNRARFKKVWLWNEWPDHGQQKDIGIDIVAKTYDDQLIAIQCKFISPQGRIDLKPQKVTNFTAALNSRQWNFAEGIFVSTCDHWTKDAENALNHSKIHVSRWSCEIFEKSSIDWDKVFHHFQPKKKPRPKPQKTPYEYQGDTFKLEEELAEYKTSPQLSQRHVKTLRDYQKNALNAVIKGFETADRGKLIMACGSGKTLVALRIAETLAPNGIILFLTPSISLLAQSLMDWDADAQSPLRIFSVCSDTSADQRQNQDDPLHTPLLEIKIPPTTNPQKLANAFQNHQPNAQGLTVIFCTYQSLDVIHQAQTTKQNPLPPLDLIICDEAHRTTGQSDPNSKFEQKNKNKKTETKGFQRVHDPEFIGAGKRLYMTATPRIYGDRAQRKAAAKQILLASMDDEKLFGQNFYQLGFGTAIDEKILCDYKVIIQEVDLEQASRYLDAELRAEKSEINLDNGARMIGCWNALRKHGKLGVFAENEPPARRAIAFSNRIAQSKLFHQHFPTVIQHCQKHQENNGGQSLECETKHVDGTQLSRDRANSLQWLREEPANNQCKILTNARCLTEGIDVPALDAVLFLQPRESEIDVVQAVGRVMRKSKDEDEDKKRGYIIIPIAVPKGISGRQALESGVYKTVWQVLNAVKAHDDRFAAKINQLSLAQKDYLQQKDIGQESQQSPAEEIAETLEDQLEFSSLNPALKNFVLAKIVHSMSDPEYWTNWIDTTQAVVQRTQARLSDLSQRAETKPIFDRFFHALQQHVRGMPVQEEDALEMLALHQVSRPVFDALFGKQTSPLATALDSVLDELEKYGLAKELDGMQPFFRQVKIRAQDVKDFETKQKILMHFYENFFRKTIPRKVQSLGIAYSPIEAVDYILRAVQDLLKQHWNKTLGSPGVQIIEPFAGTGTFLARLIADDSLISDQELDFKYQNEIFGNEILPLAYYAAQANIATAYEERTGIRKPFPNLWLGDTFLAYENQNNPQPTFEIDGFKENAKILENQKQSKIRVIIGNPPWSMGAKSQHDDNPNTKYKLVGKRISETYVKESSAISLMTLYDYYIHAIRWASDRIGDPKSEDNDGVFAFITNNGYIDGKAAAGLRKCLIKEFDYIYVFNLRGNARNFANAKAEGQTFFETSMAGVALLICCRKPKKNRRQRDGVLKYVQVADGLSRLAKKQELRQAVRFGKWEGKTVLKESNFKRIKPDERGDWIGQTDPAFHSMIPLYGKEGNRIFLVNSRGIDSSCDAWVFDFDRAELEARVWRMMEFFNQQPKDKSEFKHDETLFGWTRKTKKMLRQGFQMEHDPEKITTAVCSPFCKTHFYFCKSVVEELRKQPDFFPIGKPNQAICLSHQNPNFACLIADVIPNSSFVSTHTYTLPRWVYGKDVERQSNINPVAIGAFNSALGLNADDDESVDADGLFYYVYGFLHSESWRKKWEVTLRKEAARIELPRSLAEFQKLADAGRKLAAMHLNYETMAPLELEIEEADGFERDNPTHYEVEKMRYGGKRPNLDRSVIHFNRFLTIRSIPMECHSYRLGARSALDWLVNRYAIKTDKRSQIQRNPNRWRENAGSGLSGGRYLFDLIPRIIDLSLKTIEIQNQQ